MTVLRFVQRAVKAAIPPVLLLSVTGYFGWSATQGDHGTHAYAAGQQRLATAQVQERQAEAERDAWEVRVAGLRANHIDPDTLDERARVMLNLADPSDVVVPYGQANKLY